jgi:hypothetical protein
MALQWFVEEGGALFVMGHRLGDRFTKSNLNDVCKLFGFQFVEAVYADSKALRTERIFLPITERIERHPITKDLSKVCLKNCCPIEIIDDTICHGLIWASKGTVAVGYDDKQYNAIRWPAAVVSYYRGGKVVALGSDRMFSEATGVELDAHQNLKLGVNIFSFLSSSKKSKATLDFTPKVFISYQNADKEFAGLLADKLRQQNMEVWFDKFNLVIGDSLTESIDRGIIESDFFILLISDAALKSNWVKKEYQAANARALNEGKMKILPVMLEDCDRPAFLQDIMFADYRGRVDTEFFDIIRAINVHVNRMRERD